jgi:hypothetical protein
VALYETRINVPLLVMTREEVLAAVDEAVGRDSRVRHEPERPAELEPIEHAEASIAFEAASQEVAEQLAEQLHSRALHAVLALLPPDAPEMGWTSGFSEPEVVAES